MKLISPPEVTAGRDKLGTWNMTNITWSVAGKRVDTTFKIFDGSEGGQFMIFSQVCVFSVAPVNPGFPEWRSGKGERIFSQFREPTTYYCVIFTVRKRSCGKVIFLHLSVSHSVHKGGCLPHFILGYTSPRPVHVGIDMATAADGMHPLESLADLGGA